MSRIASLLLGAFILAGCDSTPAPDLMNRAEPLPGVVTSGQPDEESLRELADAGYVAVIDLRGVDEERGFDERSVVESTGMSYVSLPISGASEVSYENASALDKILGDAEGPVLLHCASSNRVGALLSLRARMRGASPEEALELGTAAGLSGLGETVKGLLNE
jgi:uncharacterized protein (TIGR01244 family)